MPPAIPQEDLMHYNKDYFKGYQNQNFKWHFWASFIRKHLRRDEPVLEMGCTYGYLFRHLKDYEKKYGVDISQHAIQQARVRSQGAEYKVMNAEKLAFPSESFQMVVAIDVMEHLKSPGRAIREIVRILKKGGLFIMVTPNLLSLSRSQRKGHKTWFAYKDPTHCSLLPKDTWKALLEENSLEVVKERTIDSFDAVPQLFFKIRNYLSYALGMPFIKGTWGDNLVLIAKKAAPVATVPHTERK